MCPRSRRFSIVCCTETVASDLSATASYTADFFSKGRHLIDAAEIATRTREHKGLALGVSTRGCQMLKWAAQAHAVVEGRNYCTPDDVKRLARPVLGHRIIEKGRDAGGSRKDSDSILAEILEEVPVPI